MSCTLLRPEQSKSAMQDCMVAALEGVEPQASVAMQRNSRTGPMVTPESVSVGSVWPAAWNRPEALEPATTSLNEPEPAVRHCHR